MLDRLPCQVDPLVFAERRAVLSGAVKIAELDRLADYLFEDGGEVEVSMSFNKERRLPIITGHIKADLQLICQSCLQAMPWDIDADFKLAVVTSSQQAERLDEGYEPLLLEGEKIAPARLVEDEILLALPDYPRHEHNCLSPAAQADVAHGKAQSSGKSNNPFSVLANLKKTGD